MEFGPSYENYTVEELNEALSQLDREAFPDREQKILDELEKRQSANAHSSVEQPEESRLQGIEGQMFSPTQAAVGAFLGGPFASIYFLRKNFETVNDDDGANNATVIGGVIAFVLIIILGFLPENFPNMAIPILTVVITRMLVEKYQCTKQEITSVDSVSFQSNWHVFIAGVISFVAFMVVAVAILLGMDFAGITAL